MSIKSKKRELMLIDVVPSEVVYNSKCKSYTYNGLPITKEEFSIIQDRFYDKIKAKKSTKPAAKKPAAKNPAKPEIKKPAAKRPKTGIVKEDPKKRAPRISTKDLLNSKNPKDVYLGIIFKLSHAVSRIKETKQEKSLVSRRMNAIKKGFNEDSLEKVQKELGDHIEDVVYAVISTKHEATKKEEKIFDSIFEKYKSFMNDSRVGKKKENYKKELNNVVNVLGFKPKK